jgi:hypothetical protein
MSACLASVGVSGYIPSQGFLHPSSFFCKLHSYRCLSAWLQWGVSGYISLPRGSSTLPPFLQISFLYCRCLPAWLQWGVSEYIPSQGFLLPSSFLADFILIDACLPGFSGRCRESGYIPSQGFLLPSYFFCMHSYICLPTCMPIRILYLIAFGVIGMQSSSCVTACMAPNRVYTVITFTNAC